MSESTNHPTDPPELVRLPTGELGIVASLPPELVQELEALESISVEKIPTRHLSPGQCSRTEPHPDHTWRDEARASWQVQYCHGVPTPAHDPHEFEDYDHGGWGDH